MPDIHFPTADGARTTLMQRLDQKFDALPPAEVPVSPAMAADLKQLLGEWTPLVATRRAAASGQSGDVEGLQAAQATAITWVSHYFQVFNLAVRRGGYPAGDRALFGLPVSSADLPDFRAEADLVTWLGNLAEGDAALKDAKRPDMTNPTAAEVAAKGLLFTNLLAKRDTSGQGKTAAAGAVDKLRPEVDDLLSDIYAELKHRHRKLAAPAWRDIARTYGFRFTNHRGEHPEGRYEDALLAGETREVYEGTFSPTLRLRLRNTGLTPWEIALAPTDAAFPAGRGLRVAPGQEVRCGLPELGNVADRHLLLRNLSADQTGAWEIEFEAHD